MLDKLFGLVQLGFGASLSTAFIVAHKSGSLTLHEVIILIFLALYMTVVGLLMNSNLLKSRILARRLEGAVKNETDKAHLLHLIKERKNKNSQALITEIISVVMAGGYVLGAYNEFSVMMFLSLLIHCVFSISIFVGQKVIDNKNKHSIEKMLA